MNFVQLLKYDKESFKVEYGVENDYSSLFNSQFVLNAVGVKLELTNSVLNERKLLLNEIKNSITLIDTLKQ